MRAVKTYWYELWVKEQKDADGNVTRAAERLVPPAGELVATTQARSTPDREDLCFEHRATLEKLGLKPKDVEARVTDPFVG